jgi:hypothetical protein
MISCDHLLGIVPAWGLSLLGIQRQFGGHRAVDFSDSYKLLEISDLPLLVAEGTDNMEGAAQQFFPAGAKISLTPKTT